MMNQEETQQETQANSAAFEGQRVERAGAASPAQPDRGQRRVHRCANCDIEFFWSPTIVQNKVYCCSGCAAGGPCTCDYSLYSSVTIMGVIYYDQ
ncbi:MAG TPA: hypothetical protein VHD63_10980 [Ktedonobacteraceae bacterium]|jgi:hypothetical protein|nr:hypothetical protein [Ktedonobacteraceae bacterium]